MKLLLLFLFSIFSLLALVIPVKYKYRYVLFSFLGFILVMVASLRSEVGNPDYPVYRLLYEDAKTGGAIVELSYVYFSHLISFIFGDFFYLILTYACLAIYFKLLAIRQVTELLFLSLAVYVSYFFILHEMIQIRVGVASAFLLLCVKPIYDRNLKKFLFFFFLAVFFHVSSLIILPLWFLGKFKGKLNIIFLILMVPVSYCIYFINVTILNFIPIPYVQEKLDIYMQLQELEAADFLTKINVFNYVFVGKIFIFYFLLYKHKLLTDNNKYTMILLNIYALSLFMYPALAMMPVLAGRISEFFGAVEIILIPFLYYIIRPRYIAVILILVWSLGILMVNLFKSNLLG